MYFKLVVICAHYYFLGFLLAILLLFVLFFNGDVRSVCLTNPFVYAFIFSVLRLNVFFESGVCV